MHKHCYRLEIQTIWEGLKCPARGQICHKCKGLTLLKMCKTKNIKQTVNQVEWQTDYAFAIQDDCKDTDR